MDDIRCGSGCRVAPQRHPPPCPSPAAAATARPAAWPPCLSAPGRSSGGRAPTSGSMRMITRGRSWRRTSLATCGRRCAPVFVHALPARAVQHVGAGCRGCPSRAMAMESTPACLHFYSMQYSVSTWCGFHCFAGPRSGAAGAAAATAERSAKRSHPPRHDPLCAGALCFSTLAHTAGLSAAGWITDHRSSPPLHSAWQLCGMCLLTTPPLSCYSSACKLLTLTMFDV